MATRILAVTGLQWGDEGKGRVCHDLAGGADIVVRAQGGANAGHTIYRNGQKFVFHLLPCGVLSSEKVNILGPAVFVDPIRLAGELSGLHDAGIDADAGHVMVDYRAPLVMPWHWAADQAGGRKIGTTGRGIGPVALSFYGRKALTLADVMHAPEAVYRSWQAYMKTRECLGLPGVDEDTVRQVREAIDVISGLAGDTVAYLHRAQTRGKRILLEGAQGALLDVLFGTYPFVTSSFTAAAALPFLAGLGRPEDFLGIGVVKAYTTRVGNGPFPTEDHTKLGEMLRSTGREFGATTGRPRRCGWLDLVALDYVCRVTGTRALVITKLDVLAEVGEFRVATAYRDGTGKTVPWTRVTKAMEGLKPVYETFHAGAPEPDTPWVKQLVQLIESTLKIPVIGVTMGPETGDATYFSDPWNM